MEIRESKGARSVAELAWSGHPAAGCNHRCMVSAEIGNIHDGSLGNCYSLIDACASAGVDCIKMQCHCAADESSPAERFPKRFQFHPQDAARRDYWRRMEFSRRQWEQLAVCVHSHSLQFIVSPFSVAGLARIAHLADMIKVASGEANHWNLLTEIGKVGKPVVLSTGMTAETQWVTTGNHKAAISDGKGSRSDIDRAINDYLKPARRDDCIVLQCTTAYPCPFKWVGLNKVYEYSRQQFVLGGLSDHSGTIWPGIAAAALGAHMVEVHVCWDKQQFGADASSSLTIDELRQLVEGIRAIEEMRRNPVDKTELLKELPDIDVYRDGKQRQECTGDSG